MSYQFPATGVLALGRPTFDVAYAEEVLGGMIHALRGAGVEILGEAGLQMTPEGARAAYARMEAAGAERLLILQVTFTDAELVAELGAAFTGPLAIWSVPEPRLGGRLRLNSLCGLNLAGHALSLRHRPFSYLHAAPDADGIGASIAALLSGEREVTPVAVPPVAVPGDGQGSGPGAKAARKLKGARIARLGDHPGGFDTCAFDRGKLAAMADVTVTDIPLEALFARAREASPEAVQQVRERAEADVGALSGVDQPQLDRSLRLKCALDGFRAEGSYDAFAIRCWPETFTEYGGAICGPVSMMGEGRTPCACEADVYGAVTSRLMQDIADAPVFLVDLVDVDGADDSAVVWHCGQAPISMRDPGAVAEATIHTNRKMPLLYQFPLRAGRVTFGRISQGYGETKMVIAGGEMLARPMAFTGTSGVVRFDRPAEEVFGRAMDAGLEHHMALVYGDHRDALAGAAAALGLPVVDLCGGAA